jgi:flagellar hook protein FlgE
MIYAMSAGTRGMLDNSNALGVVGSNISNVNTIGFKTGTDSFANYFANALTWGTGDNWNQGSVQTTGKSTDLAIVGKGLFMVTDSEGGTFYTRAGAFNLDADGNLVNTDGLNVQGYKLTADGSLGALGDINFSETTSPATATTEMITKLNLNNETAAASVTVTCSEDFSGVTYTAVAAGEEGNEISIRYVDSGEGGLSVTVAGNAITVDLGGAEDEEKTAKAVAEAVNNSDASELVTATAVGNGEGAVEVTGPDYLTGGKVPSNFSTTMTVYDSMGNAIDLTVDFVYQLDEEDNPQWVWAVRSSDGKCETWGVIKFDGSGQIDMEESGWGEGEMPESPVSPQNFLTDGNPVIKITELSSGAGDLNIDWDLLATGYAAASGVTSQSQNGCTSGTIVDAKIDNNGVVSGVFSNGKSRPLYQIALANFANYSGLESVGGSMFEATASSGAAIVGTANSGGRGSIQSGSLEMSNVDLAQEFVKMITIQRAYQANSRVISTSDEMMQELNSLKR